jgi:hypothetical protein
MSSPSPMSAVFFKAILVQCRCFGGIHEIPLLPSGIKREWYVCSVGRPQARWSDDLLRTAGRSWMRVAEDRARWRDIGEADVHQWTVVG